MYLPPATPAQAREVYAMLHVTPATVRLGRIYDRLYFGSAALHLIVRFAFLWLGLSRTVRLQSDRLAFLMLRIGLVRNLRRYIRNGVFRAEQWGLPVRPVIVGAKNSSLGKSLQRVNILWPPELARSAFIYYLIYTFIFTMFWSPLTYYEDFLLPHRFGLSHQPLFAWVGGVLKDSFVSAIIGSVTASIVTSGISMYPQRWAKIFAYWSAPIILVGIFLDPLFSQIDNHFTSLSPTSPLYVPLHQLANRAGVPNAAILVADKSKQTDETNAYVTGLGSSAQIVLWDTTIKRMRTDEVVAIIGHELGHYVEHHVIIGGVLAAVSMFVFLPALKWLAELILYRFGRRWKINSLSDPAALPVLLISLSLLNFLTSPVTNAVSRTIEHRADSFGLAVTGNRLAMARALVDLANENLEDPFPSQWEVFWLQDHPPFGERIKFALYGQPMTVRH
jgi:STE24 endopeptidase